MREIRTGLTRRVVELAAGGRKDGLGKGSLIHRFAHHFMRLNLFAHFIQKLQFKMEDNYEVKGADCSQKMGWGRTTGS